MSRAVAIFFGVGLMRPAPGTWGSLAGVLIGWAIDVWLGFPALALAFVIATAAGFWACQRELAARPGDDPSEIVIDEVAGQLLALLITGFAFFLVGHSIAFPGVISAFIFFRLFDIWKPWLVGRADRRHDPAGVMLDDLWAGLFAGIVTVLIGTAFHHGAALLQALHG